MNNDFLFFFVHIYLDLWPSDLKFALPVTHVQHQVSGVWWDLQIPSIYDIYAILLPSFIKNIPSSCWDRFTSSEIDPNSQYVKTNRFLPFSKNFLLQPRQSLMVNSPWVTECFTSVESFVMVNKRQRTIWLNNLVMWIQGMSELANRPQQILGIFFVKLNSIVA